MVFDNMIADMITNKKRNPIITETFIRCRKLNISLVFYYTISIQNTRRYKTKLCTFFYYENST